MSDSYIISLACLTKFFLGINRIYDGVEAETRKSQALFQIIIVLSAALHKGLCLSDG